MLSTRKVAPSDTYEGHLSYVDLENATPENVLAHFVMECRGGSAFLPYSDHQIVAEWLRLANGNLDEILVVLSETLPAYFAPKGDADTQLGGAPQAGKRPRSLAGVRKLVSLRLEDRKRRASR